MKGKNARPTPAATRSDCGSRRLRAVPSATRGLSVAARSRPPLPSAPARLHSGTRRSAPPGPAAAPPPPLRASRGAHPKVTRTARGAPAAARSHPPRCAAPRSIPAFLPGCGSAGLARPLPPAATLIRARPCGAAPARPRIRCPQGHAAPRAPVTSRGAQREARGAPAPRRPAAPAPPSRAPAPAGAPLRTERRSGAVPNGADPRRPSSHRPPAALTSGPPPPPVGTRRPRSCPCPCRRPPSARSPRRAAPALQPREGGSREGKGRGRGTELGKEGGAGRGHRRGGRREGDEEEAEEEGGSGRPAGRSRTHPPAALRGRRPLRAARTGQRRARRGARAPHSDRYRSREGRSGAGRGGAEPSAPPAHSPPARPPAAAHPPLPAPTAPRRPPVTWRCPSRGRPRGVPTCGALGGQEGTRRDRHGAGRGGVPRLGPPPRRPDWRAGGDALVSMTSRGGASAFDGARRVPGDGDFATSGSCGAGPGPGTARGAGIPRRPAGAGWAGLPDRGAAGDPVSGRPDRAGPPCRPAPAAGGARSPAASAGAGRGQRPVQVGSRPSRCSLLGAGAVAAKERSGPPDRCCCSPSYCRDHRGLNHRMKSARNGPQGPADK